MTLHSLSKFEINKTMHTDSLASSLNTKDLRFIPTLASRWLLISLIGLLCGVYLLLPIERGFPSVMIVGYPLTLTILITWLSLGVVTFLSGWKLGQALFSKYVLAQTLLVLSLLISALLSTDIEAAVFVVFNYFTTFVVTYIVVHSIFELGFRRQFVLILCAVASVAALVGVIEGLFRVYLPFYRNLFLNYQYADFLYSMARVDFRAFGTLGNPLTYAVAMVLSVPFALEIRRPVIRYLSVALLISAAWLAVSTTALVMGVILAVGVFAVSRRKKRLLFGVMILLMLIAGLSFLWLPNNAAYSRTWAAEFEFADPENRQFNNIKVRYELLGWAIENFLKADFADLVFGYGLKSSIDAVSALGFGRLDTLDNTYTTLLFEGGLMGLLLFLFAQIGILVRNRRGVRCSLHWYTVLGLLVAGMSFTTILYSTFNFVWVASVVTLTFDAHSLTKGSKEVGVGPV